MSAPLYRIKPKVLSLLHERGQTVSGIAQVARMGITRAQQTLANHPGRTLADRRCVMSALLTPERLALGWDEQGYLLPVEHSGRCSTPPLSPDPLATNATTT